MTTDIEAAEPLGACHACGAEIPGNSGSASKYGVRQLPAGGIGYIYVCGPRCRSKAGAQAHRPSCRECGQAFEHDYARGRRPDYCGRPCSSLAERRRARVWKAAAKSTLPSKPAALAELRAEVAKVQAELEERRTTAPTSARELLARYAAALAKHRADLARQAAVERAEGQHREWRQEVQKEHAAGEAELSGFLRSVGA